MDTVYTKGRTVASSSSADSIVLSGFTDPAANAISFGHVVDLIVENVDPTNTLTRWRREVWVVASAAPAAGVGVPPGGEAILHVSPRGWPSHRAAPTIFKWRPVAGPTSRTTLPIAGRSL